MRELTIEERNIVNKLVYWKKEFKLEELRTMNLLRQNLDCFAIRWDKNPKKTVKIYVKEKDVGNTPLLNKQYFKICDFLYFMDELEENHYIKLQTISFSDEKTSLHNALYDTSKYQYGLPEGINVSNSLDCFFETANKGKCLYAIEQLKQEAYTDCVDLLDKYYNKIIYPLPLLEDLVKHKYTSIEKRQFNEQMCWTRLSVFIASIAVLLTALFEGFKSDTSIDEKQFKRLEQAIMNCNTDISDTIYITP